MFCLVVSTKALWWIRSRPGHVRSRLQLSCAPIQSRCNRYHSRRSRSGDIFPMKRISNGLKRVASITFSAFQAMACSTNRVVPDHNLFHQSECLLRSCPPKLVGHVRYHRAPRFNCAAIGTTRGRALLSAELCLLSERYPPRANKVQRSMANGQRSGRKIEKALARS